MVSDITLAVRRQCSSNCTNLGHMLNSWQGTVGNRYAYCAKCRGKLYVCVLRRDDPNVEYASVRTNHPFIDELCIVAGGNLLRNTEFCRLGKYVSPKN